MKVNDIEKGPLEFESSTPLTDEVLNTVEEIKFEDGSEMSLVAPYKSFVIGISGKIGSGKDETFLAIQDMIAKEVANVKFAEKLKQMCAILIGCTREQLEDHEFKNTPLPHLNNITPRFIMIQIGDGLRSLLYERVWIDSALAAVKKYTVITDIRYPNEADEVNAIGITIRLERDAAEKLDTPTETALDNYPNFTYKVENNGTIAELRSAIHKILNKEGIL